MAKREEFQRKTDPNAADASLRAYVKKLEAENDRLKRQSGTDERLYEEVSASFQALPAPKSVRYSKPKLEHAPLNVLLCLADPHAEQSVRAEEMEGFAQYDFETFESRMWTTAEKAIELTHIMRQASTVSELVIASLGDWFCGKIQPQEESYNVTMPMPIAVPKVSYTFAQIVRYLSAHFDRVRVIGVCGNHGRDGRKAVFSLTADRNWDMSVYLIARGYTEQCKNVEWVIPRSIMHVEEIMGHRCLFSHSAEVNMNNRVPYYPIENTLQQERQLRSRKGSGFEYAFLGHWHHHAVLDGNIIICPSMIGPDAYSRFKLHRAADPQQLLCFFSEKNGLGTQWPINL